MRPEPRLPVAVMNFIVDHDQRFLFVSRTGERWRTMGGQLEEDETVTECVDREVEEELGGIRFRTLDVLDAHVFDYPGLGYMLSVFTLLLYEEGTIVAADDIEGWHVRWFEPGEIAGLDIEAPHQRELVAKARYLAAHYLKTDDCASEDLGFLKHRWERPS